MLCVLCAACVCLCRCVCVGARRREQSMMCRGKTFHTLFVGEVLKLHVLPNIRKYVVACGGKAFRKLSGRGVAWNAKLRSTLFKIMDMCRAYLMHHFPTSQHVLVDQQTILKKCCTDHISLNKNLLKTCSVSNQIQSRGCSRLARQQPHEPPT